VRALRVVRGRADARVGGSHSERHTHGWTFGIDLGPLWTRRADSGAVRQPGRYRRGVTAAISLVRERTVASHFGSRSFPASANSARWSRTRRQATGESITRFAQSLMPWASRSMTLSTIFTAIALFAAARRSSYAALLQRSEHHVAGRPVGRREGNAPPHRGHFPTLTPTP
jgi:hypothetical protein